MFLWAGLHQACIRNHSGAVKDLKFGRNERIYVHFGEVIMFFRKDPPQTEGRRNADQLIKTSPVIKTSPDGQKRLQIYRPAATMWTLCV